MTRISPFSDWPHPRRHSVTQLGTSLNLGHVCGDSHQSIQWQTSPVETQYQLGMSLNHGHIHDSHQSIQWQTSPVETQYQLMGVSLNQGHVCGDSHQSIRWQTSPMETQYQLGMSLNQGHLHNDFHQSIQWQTSPIGNTMSVNGCATEPKSCMWWLASVHTVTDLTHGNTVLLSYNSEPRSCVWWLIQRQT